MKAKTFKWRHGLWLAIFLFSLLCQGQNAYSQWWKDTVWTKETNQANLWNLKFSNTDSLIVGGGVFFDAKNGNELGRVGSLNAVYFYNNDLNFLRVNTENNVIEIYDTKTFKVIDSLEYDGVKIGNIDISKDERFVVGTITNGIRSWDLQTKRILKTKIWPNETNLSTIGIGMIKFDCSNQRFIGQFAKSYYNPNDPKNPIHIGYFGVYDIITLDSVNYFENATTFRISNTCKYMAKKVYQDKGIEIYDFNTKKLLWQIPVNPSSLTGYEFSPDDKYLVTASNNAEFGLQIWDIIQKKMHYEYPKGSYNVISVSHKGDNIVFSTGSWIMLLLSHFDGVSVKEPSKPEKIIYPNPTDNTINLIFELKTANTLNYSIFNEAGQLIKILLVENTQAGLISKTFNVNELPNGKYFLKISGQEFKITYSVIIMR